MALPSIKQQYSLKPDMQFGWKPEDVHGAPIPMFFDYETFERLQNPRTFYPYPVYFYGRRYMDSLEVHRSYANKSQATGPTINISSYHIKFPPQENILDAINKF